MTDQPVSTRRERAVLVIATLAMLAATVILFLAARRLSDERNAAAERAETAEQYVARIDADCKGASGEALAEQLLTSGRCGVAEKITQKADADPLPRDGRDGQPGANGADGKDGAPGADGKDGTDGKDGADGEPGSPGPPGAAGAPGPGFSDIDINDAGELVVTSTAGTVLNLGRVVGPAGADGKDGATPDLTGYAREDWVLALIRALGCVTTVADQKGPPILVDCAITGKP